MTKRNLLWAGGWLVACCAIYATPLWFLSTGPQAVDAAIIVTSSASDTTAPLVSSSNIDATGSTLTINLNEVCTGTTGFTITPSAGGAATLVYVSGSGSKQYKYTLSRVLLQSPTEDADLNYTAASGDIVDGSSNEIADFSGTAITNNSTQSSSGPVSLLTDSFETQAPDSGWSSTTGTDGLSYVTSPAPPTGGGTYVLQQSYESGTPDWFVYNFSPALAHGDIVHLDYHIRYGASFDEGASDNVKLSIWRNSGSPYNQDVYIQDWHSFGGGSIRLFLQLAAISPGSNEVLAANQNGGSITMDDTLNQWLKFNWEIKIAYEDGTEDGYVKGWVDDTLKWDYTSQYTGNESSNPINSITFPNGTNSSVPASSNSVRYLDLIEIAIERAP